MLRFLLLAIMLTTSLVANELKTAYSYQNALYQARKAHKLVMVMMALRHCPACIYMKDIILERPQIRSYLEEHFVTVIKDIEHDRYPERFAVIDSPTLFFIDPENEKEIIPKLTGGLQPAEFLALLQSLTAAEANGTQPATVTPDRTIAPCSKNEPCKEEQKVRL